MIQIEEGNYVYWRHRPSADVVTSNDVAICTVEDVPESSADHSEGLRILRGVSSGKTTLTLAFNNNDPDVVIDVVIESQRDQQLILPTIQINGPTTLQVGETGNYTCQVVGGRYTSVILYNWSCLGTGQSGPSASVDTTGRREGTYQLCCTVQLQLDIEGELPIIRSTAGSVLVLIEEPD
ncbi:MAG: hypothetical protein OXC91_02335 [Rhodobacteraceae bacterium]|nr:hypothetical protein [Paracoccaceae bacterium]